MTAELSKALPVSLNLERLLSEWSLEEMVSLTAGKWAKVQSVSQQATDKS